MPFKSARPTFSFFASDHATDINEDLNMFARERHSGFIEMCQSRQSAQFGDREAQWRDCHQKFTEYMGSLNTLMSNR
jgi:hypothetical protein